MEQTYHCTNPNCSFPGRDQFEMTFNKELVMDEQNMAAIFCPFCKKEMTPSVLLVSKDNCNNLGNCIH